MIVEIANNKTTLVRAMMQSCGLWYYDQNGDINITNNEALKAAFETILKMKEAGILYEAESTEGRAAALNNGQVASVVNAPWFISSIKQAEDQSGLWRAVRIPKFANISSSVNASNVGRLQLVCTESSANKDRSHQIPSGCMAGKHRFL